MRNLTARWPRKLNNKEIAHNIATVKPPPPFFKKLPANSLTQRIPAMKSTGWSGIKINWTKTKCIPLCPV